MPTIPKAIAAIYFAAFAWFCGDLIKPMLPEGTQTGLLDPTLAAIGFISGWRVSGARAGGGLRAGFGYGLTTVAVIAFWGLLAFAGTKMIQYSLDRRFDGPMEALKAMVGFIVEYAVMLAHDPEVQLPALGGGGEGGGAAQGLGAQIGSFALRALAKFAFPITAMVGGLFGGWLTEWAARRWD